MPMSETLEFPANSADASIRDGCACGSGLSHPKCCGLDLEKGEPAGSDRSHGEQLGALARAYRSNDREAARRIALDILELSPRHKDALGTFFNILSDTGEFDTAAIIVERLTRIDQNDAVSRMIAAQFFLARGDLIQAQSHARMLVRLAPEAVISHFIMGQVFLGHHNGKAAEHHFRLALGLPTPRGPQVPAVQLESHLAFALRDQGRFAEARGIFERLTEHHGQSLTILMAWARLEEAAQNFDAAAGLLDRAMELAPGDAHVAVARATLLRRTRQPERALAALEASRDDAESAEGEALLQRGQILDSMGRYDEAFAAFETFKRRLRERSGHSYQSARAAQLVNSLRTFFTEGRSRLLPRAEVRDDSPQPIFIIGFPRSGTTLVEQTLSSHPEIAAGDELPIMHMLAERAKHLLGSPLDYPKALSELWLGDRAGHINTLRDLYLNEAVRFGAIDPAKRWFTDKMPLNETHLGLISLIFPRSPVVHLVRHPLDVVLSVFSNGLTHGFFCAYELESAARHYALIADLLVDYRAALPVNYHAVRYEDLVADQEREVRSLLDFIGEPFDPRALEFHANARPARTASYAQVTEKLYDRSVFRYRNYIEHLKPIIPILEPAIARLGYLIDR